MARTMVLFQRREVTTVRLGSAGESKRIVARVWVDLPGLDALIVKAAKNKGKKAHDGALFVEVHTVDTLPEVK